MPTSSVATASWNHSSAHGCPADFELVDESMRRVAGVRQWPVLESSDVVEVAIASELGDVGPRERANRQPCRA